MTPLPDCITRCLTPSPEIIADVMEEDILLDLRESHLLILELQQEIET